MRLWVREFGRGSETQALAKQRGWWQQEQAAHLLGSGRDVSKQLIVACAVAQEVEHENVGAHASETCTKGRAAAV